MSNRVTPALRGSDPSGRRRWAGGLRSSRRLLQRFAYIENLHVPAPAAYKLAPSRAGSPEQMKLTDKNDMPFEGGDPSGRRRWGCGLRSLPVFTPTARSCRNLYVPAPAAFRIAPLSGRAFGALQKARLTYRYGHKDITMLPRETNQPLTRISP